jgi:hypothetical protein
LIRFTTCAAIAVAAFFATPAFANDLNTPLAVRYESPAQLRCNNAGVTRDVTTAQVACEVAATDYLGDADTGVDRDIDLYLAANALVAASFAWHKADHVHAQALMRSARLILAKINDQSGPGVKLLEDDMDSFLLKY